MFHDRALLTLRAVLLLSKQLSKRDDGLLAFDNAMESFATTFKQLSEGVEATMNDLRARRNEFSPINRFPIEILQEIFRAGSGWTGDGQFKLSISAVCTLWRRAALADPELWSFVELPAEPSGLVQLSFERSGSRPLTIMSKHIKPWHKDVLSQQSSRTRAIILNDVAITYDLTFERQIIAFPAPQLEELTLHLRPSYTDSTIYREISDVPLPKLRSLVLKNGRLPWFSGRYNGLKKLAVTMPVRGWVRADEDLLVVFVDSPDLEHVSLVFPPHERGLRAPVSQPSERIRTRSLRTLKLSMTMDEIVDILAALDTTTNIRTIDITAYTRNPSPPQNPHLHFNPNSNANPQSGDQLLSALFSPQCLPYNLIEHLNRLSVCFPSPAPSSVKSRPGHRMSRFAGSGRHPSNGEPYTLDIQYEDRDRISVLRTIRTHYTMPSLQELTFEVSTVFPFQYNDAALLLGHCPSVTRLAVGLSGGAFSLQAFQVALRWATRSTGSSLPPVTSVRFFGLKACLSTGQALPDFTAPILSFLRSFSPTLEEVTFDSCALQSAIDPKEDMARLVKDLRALRGVRISLSGLSFTKLGDVYFPRDVWPLDEEYTWTCSRDKYHEKVGGRCEGCGLP